MTAIKKISAELETELQGSMKVANAKLVTFNELNNLPCPAEIKGAATVTVAVPMGPPKTDFKTRLGVRMIGTLPQRKPQDFEFPAKDKLSYDNPIVGFVQKSNTQFNGFNYITAKGDKSTLPLKYSGDQGYTDKVIPKNAIVRKVVMNAGGAAGMMNGVSFFDEDGTLLLQAGSMSHAGITKTMLLKEEERLVGVLSNLATGYGSSNSPRQYEF